MEPDAAAKHELRRAAAEARAGIDPDARARARAAIRSLVLDRAAGAGWSRVAAYEPLRSEPGSVELLAGLDALGVGVLVPITLPDRDLDWAPWSPSGTGGALGVGAIADVDAVLVPALAVARDGTRLGRGGGSYDRALARCGAAIPLVALLFDGELVERLPREPWDRPVTAVAAPSGWRTVGNTGVAGGSWQS